MATKGMGKSIARRCVSPAKFVATNMLGETLIIEYVMGKITITNHSTNTVPLEMEYHQPDEKDSTMSGEQATYLVLISDMPNWQEMIGEDMVRQTLAEFNNAEKVMWDEP